MYFLFINEYPFGLEFPCMPENSIIQVVKNRGLKKAIKIIFLILDSDISGSRLQGFHTDGFFRVFIYSEDSA